MPRIKLAPEPSGLAHPQLVRELVQELKSSHEFGQPLAIEEPFGGTGNTRVTVVWDKFAPVHDEQRTNITLKAYEEVDPEHANEVAVAIGLTFAEAEDEGVLRFEIIPGFKKIAGHNRPVL